MIIRQRKVCFNCKIAIRDDICKCGSVTCFIAPHIKVPKKRNTNQWKKLKIWWELRNMPYAESWCLDNIKTYAQAKQIFKQEEKEVTGEQLVKNLLEKGIFKRKRTR